MQVSRFRKAMRELVIAALLAAADALAPGASASRRAVLGQAAVSGAGALLLAPLAVRAQELKQARRPHLAQTQMLGLTLTLTSPKPRPGPRTGSCPQLRRRRPPCASRPPTPTCTAALRRAPSRRSASSSAQPRARWSSEKVRRPEHQPTSYLPPSPDEYRPPPDSLEPPRHRPRLSAPCAPGLRHPCRRSHSHARLGTASAAGASRAELERIIAVDRQALQLARAKLAGLSGREYEEEKKVGYLLCF
jgi:hypothetical protein